ncbi:MAG: hypothetical protein IT447_08770 [Phycisphaerales bacterium]|jgi:hypothetical protein|nr:hypothetical protein [Phycisphaerales bacterium]
MSDAGKKKFFTAPFLVVVVLLGLAAVGLNASVGLLKVTFRKEAVHPARAMKELPASFGPWKQVSMDVPLEADIQAALGTEDYIFRDYVNSEIAGPEVMERLANLQNPDSADSQTALREYATAVKKPVSQLDPAQVLMALDLSRKHEVMLLQKSKPQAVVNLAVTYYTGLVDTVAHVPDRCYLADGYQPREYKVESWPITKPPIDVRYINFEDQTGFGKQPRSVVYFFNVNGQFKDGANEVRYALQNLLQRYGYYAKVECMTAMADRDKSRQVMTGFLTLAMPEIQKLLPDWEKVEKGEWK